MTKQMNVNQAKQDAFNSLFDGKTVEWNNHEWRETKSGKRKEVVEGTPSKRFWLDWKQNKELLRLMGVTIFASKPVGTGEYRTHKGVSCEVKRKEWTVTVWVNKANRELLTKAGFETLVNPKSETAREFVAETQGPFDDPF